MHHMSRPQTVSLQRVVTSAPHASLNNPLACTCLAYSLPGLPVQSLSVSPLTGDAGGGSPQQILGVAIRTVDEGRSHQHSAAKRERPWASSTKERSDPKLRVGRPSGALELKKKHARGDPLKAKRQEAHPGPEKDPWNEEKGGFRRSHHGCREKNRRPARAKCTTRRVFLITTSSEGVRAR